MMEKSSRKCAFTCQIPRGLIWMPSLEGRREEGEEKVEPELYTQLLVLNYVACT